MKLQGTPVPGFKIDKDGRTPVVNEKKFDLCTQLKRKRAPRKKFAAVKPTDRDFRP